VATQGQTTNPNVTRPARWHTTPWERAWERMPAGEQLMTEQAGALTEQLELAQTMLAVAVDILAAISGKYRDQVVDALEIAATVEMGA
jgi:hypothetical protein